MNKRFYLFVMFLIMALCCSCASVKPWEKENLANQIMIFDYDKAEISAREHMMNSLEGASGGFGIGGGGCGCN